MNQRSERALSLPSDERSGGHATDGGPRAPAAVLHQVEQALRGLRFGQVTITVQDGVVVQIDRLERTRMPRLPETDS